MGRVKSDTSKKLEEFKLNKFDIDMKRLKATCPMGIESTKSSKLKDGTYNLYFPKRDCVKCNHSNECISAIGDVRRKLNVNKYYDYIKERRQLQETLFFKKEMRVRAQVEGTISEMVRKNGLRHAKYHGEKGHQFQFYLTGAALNLKRLIRVKIKGREIKKAA